MNETASRALAGARDRRRDLRSRLVHRVVATATSAWHPPGSDSAWCFAKRINS
jgi:hypothetical protein